MKMKILFKDYNTKIIYEYIKSLDCGYNLKKKLNIDDKLSKSIIKLTCYNPNISECVLPISIIKFIYTLSEIIILILLLNYYIKMQLNIKRAKHNMNYKKKYCKECELITFQNQFEICEICYKNKVFMYCSHCTDITEVDELNGKCKNCNFINKSYYAYIGVLMYKKYRIKCIICGNYDYISNICSEECKYKYLFKRLFTKRCIQCNMFIDSELNTKFCHYCYFYYYCYWYGYYWYIYPLIFDNYNG
ncbi:ORF MSV005 hypothetical protein [Melanoplus sanguinipes entomopoxvirus]|uniref:Uncharacterized protein n=1 Tax=Melanoplus sanguinipes entomopoxvirus TaxID=83191 RepID=Q9YW87_MSEPV|nr:ORF MSV005 hypothetical protein [Melanoplus sanguinipes entomopoxvirus]AAC97860.1 ORF MSV005 hypothetical protein [Melanoplus sanguinipes entomopoxvirus 'O']